MLTIGLTGGLASGKTTVAKLFAKKNITIIDTDVIAKQLVEPSMPAYDKIIAHFGQQILLNNKHIDRRKLREIIFANATDKNWLEHLLHPLIREQVFQQIKTATSPYCIVIIPLLIENYPSPFIHRILVVDCPEQIQIQRAVQRDNITEALAKNILSQQASQTERLKYADDVIENHTGLDSINEQVDALHLKYLQLSDK